MCVGNQTSCKNYDKEFSEFSSFSLINDDGKDYLMVFAEHYFWDIWLINMVINEGKVQNFVLESGGKSRKYLWK